MPIQGKDRKDLRRAVELLENPSFISRIIDVIGQPIEKVMDSLPATATGKIQDAVQATLNKLLVLTVRTMGEGFHGPASTLTHKIASGLSGAIGGAFGLPALAVELPVSTSIILRSIADIARSEGEEIETLQADWPASKSSLWAGDRMSTIWQRPDTSRCAPPWQRR